MSCRDVTLRDIVELAEPAGLTARELDVIRLSLQSASTGEVALLLGITPRAVRYRWESAMRKLRHQITSRESS